MLGLQFVGELVGVYRPSAGEIAAARELGNGEPFWSVKVAGKKWDGEPFWFRAVFSGTMRDGQPTRVRNEVLAVLGEDAYLDAEQSSPTRPMVSLRIMASATKKGGVWYRVEGAEALAAVPAGNGKAPVKATA